MSKKLKYLPWLLSAIFAGATAYLYYEKEALKSSPIERPTEKDFKKIIGQDPSIFVDKVLTVMEQDIVPKTLEGVKKGNKVFGAAVMRKDNLNPIVTATNTEDANPLMHGEVTAIFDFYHIPTGQRLSPNQTVFFATHEPCPLCLSSISWGGWDNFFYLFSYEETKNAYGIPYDLEMLHGVFRDEGGSYSRKNRFWSAWSIEEVIKQVPPEKQALFHQRIQKLKAKYAAMSEIYQRAKKEGTSAAVPLK